MNEDAIIGTLLGDAWIQRIIRKSGKDYYTLSFQQKQEEYALWKANIIGQEFYYKSYIRIDSRSGKSYKVTNVRIKNIDNSYKRELYNLFYTPKKEISLEILDLLTPIGIAIWYCDDGSMYYNGNNCHLTISTNGFSLESIEVIVGWFREKFNLDFKITTQRAIRLTSKKECEKFMALIEHHIPDCMSYKKLSEAIKKHITKLSSQSLKYKNGQIRGKK